MASNSHFYETTFTMVNQSLSTYITDVASNIIDSFTPVTTTLLIIYVVLWGVAMIRGMITEPVIDGFSRIARLSLIVGIALNVGRYNGYISDFLWNTPDALAGYVASGYSDGYNNVQYLDSLLNQIYDLADMFWTQANATSTFGMPDLVLLISGFFIIGVGAAATGFAAFLLIISKMALAIILAIGPIFLLLIMFEPTKRFFNAWIGQAMNFVFLAVLTSAAIKLILSILQAYLTDVMQSGLMTQPSVNLAIPAIILCFIGFLVLQQLPSIASALGGGVAIGTLGSVAWAYGRAKGGISAMRPTNLRRSYNGVRSDVRIASSAVRTTAGIPASVYRKITGSTVNRINKG
jgi:type IV secretion system protein VirB6